LITKHSHIF